MLTVSLFVKVFFLLNCRLMDERDVVKPSVGSLGPVLGASVGSPGRSLELLWAVLGCSWGLWRRSCATLGPSVGGLGLLLGPQLAALS